MLKGTIFNVVYEFSYDGKRHRFEYAGSHGSAYDSFLRLYPGASVGSYYMEVLKVPRKKGDLRVRELKDTLAS